MLKRIVQHHKGTTLNEFLIATISITLLLVRITLLQNKIVLNNNTMMECTSLCFKFKQFCKQNDNIIFCITKFCPKATIRITFTRCLDITLFTPKLFTRNIIRHQTRDFAYKNDFIQRRKLISGFLYALYLKLDLSHVTIWLNTVQSEVGNISSLSLYIVDVGLCSHTKGSSNECITLDFFSSFFSSSLTEYKRDFSYIMPYSTLNFMFTLFC